MWVLLACSFFLTTVLHISLAGAQSCGPAYTSAGVEAATLNDDYCAFSVKSDLQRPRGVIAVGETVVVVEASENANKISAHWFPDEDSLTFESMTVVDSSDIVPELNHGVAYYGGFLYASSETTVFRWAWDGERESLPLGRETRETVIVDMPVGNPSANRHRTRTLLFNDEGDLFVSVGSEAIDDTDPDAYRARILQYSASKLGGEAIHWTTGTSFAIGTRNAVAIGMRNNVLHSADNGQGEIIDDRFGGNLTPDHPAERINRHDFALQFFGYPYCWTVGSPRNDLLPATGSQVLYSGFLDSAAEYNPGMFGSRRKTEVVNQQFCDTQVEAPIAILPAHSAPLGLLFYKKSQLLPGAPFAFPDKYEGSGLVFEHGSFDREVPVGYQVSLLEMDEAGAVIDQRPFLYRADGQAAFADPVPTGSGVNGGTRPGNGFRPVTGAWLPDGSLVLSSDASNELIVLRYLGSCEEDGTE